MRYRRFHRVLFHSVLSGCLLAVGWLAGPAMSQVIVQNPRNDTPVIARVTPLGLPLGETVQVTVTGQRLAGLSGLLCSGQAQLVEVLENTDKLAVLRLRAADDAELGAYPFHVLCEAGLSNPRVLRIDNCPQCVEIENNDSLQRATPLSAPCAMTGALTKTDRDFYRFEAATGQRLVFDLEAQRIGSALEPYLSLFDSRGREIAGAVTPTPDIAPDARLSHTFTEAGVYYLAVRDRTYQGADFCAYYLRVGDPLYATRCFPLGGQRGQQVDVTLEGGSLPEPVTGRVDLSASAAGQHETVDHSHAARHVANSPPVSHRRTAGDHRKRAQRQTGGGADH